MIAAVGAVAAIGLGSQAFVASTPLQAKHQLAALRLAT